MVEVLVTIVLMSISLLGLAVLQGQGLSLTTDSYARTQASILASDIMEQIRANPDNLDDYGGSAASTCDHASSSAANDLACWQQSVTNALGSGSSGAIAVDTSIPAAVVTISWLERTLRQDEAESYDDDVTRTATWTTEL